MDGAEVQRAGIAQALTWTPIVCAVHCMTVPALALVAPMVAVPEAIEGVLMAGTTVAAAALIGSGVRTHCRRRVVVPIVVGLALWLAALLGAPGLPEWVLGGAGGLTLYAGLRWNERLRHAARRGGCGCADCRAGAP